MKQRIFIVLAAFAMCCMSSCLVDNEIRVDFVVENQCSDTVVIRYSKLEWLHPDTTVNNNIAIDRTNGLIAVPSGAKVCYRDVYGAGGRGRKAGKIDVEAHSYLSIERFFTDSITIIFSDSTSLLHTRAGTTENNILKRESYTRTGYVFTYTITEADHQAALAPKVTIKGDFNPTKYPL